jgi:myo-inositol-1(or 4)-monophosphatase
MLSLNDHLRLARQAACAAGDVIASTGNAVVRNKSSEIDLVTEADVAAEAAIRSVLLAGDSSIPVWGEEGGDAGADAPVKWIVDPIDGTTNFVHGYPAYSVSIGLERDGVYEVAVILDVPAGRLYHASRRGGAFCNDQPIHVSETETLDASLVGTGFAYDRRERADFYLHVYRAAMMSVQGIRRSGSAALDLAAVACGRLDGFWEFNLRPWDVAAGLLLITEAGGAVDPIPGESLRGSWPCPMVSNGRIHESLKSMLKAAISDR